MSFRGIAGWAALLVSAPALAQYATDFEDVNASGGGTVLTGQAGYYLPTGPPGDVDFFAFTYAGNTLGVPQNPCGDGHFISGTGPGGTTFARAQHDLSWAFGTNTATVSFDVLTLYEGAPGAATQNIGSGSGQPGTGARFIALARWPAVIPSEPTTWNADYVYFDSAGVQITGEVPDPAFQGLATGKWYRRETDVNMHGNLIKEVRIIDLETGATASHRPSGWFLVGGAAGAPLPTAFRWFAGGSGAGNRMAFDNLHIDIVPATPCEVACDPCDTNCDGVIDAFDIEPFINVLLGGMGCASCTGDVNGDSVIDAFDIEPFINCLVGP
jgi:hypothetical protein